MYCPQCRVEYFEGFTECSDCRVPLLAGTPRLLGVLNLAAEKGDWGKPLPAGRFRGVAVVNNIGSFFRIKVLLLSFCLAPTLTPAIVVRHDRDAL